MRKLIDDNNIISPAPAPILPFSPSPSPALFIESRNYVPETNPFFDYFPSLPINATAYDFATLAIISTILLLSLLSLTIIFHLRLQSRWSHHLQNFSSIWSVRLLLVAFISFWAVNEVLRLPFFRRQYIYPFMPPLSLTEEANICKIYVVLSLGLFEPGILITLMFLVNVSIKKKSPNHVSAISTVAVMCLPVVLLQVFVVFLAPFEAHLPAIMHRNSVLWEDIYGNQTVMCTYPLVSCTVFAAFSVAYVFGFLMSCWRVLSLVINKRIRNRINMLALAVCVGIPMQCLFMALSSMWSPETTAFVAVVLAMFVCVALCSIVGMCILVIKPTVDALAAVSDSDRWNPSVRSRSEEGDGSSRSSLRGGEDEGR